MPQTKALETLLAQMVDGEAFTPYNNANAYLGVGDSSTAFANSQTDLQAATNKLRVAMDSTYPQRAGSVLTYRATFTSGQANWVWNEWALFNASSAGTMHTRAVASLGTKTTGSWQLTVTVQTIIP